MTKKIWLDLETSGLDSTKHQILTGCFLITEGKDIIATHEFKVKQQPWAIIDEKAMQINGINLEEHNKVADAEFIILDGIIDFLIKNEMYNIKSVLHGHNVNFDVGFLNAMIKRYNAKLYFHYHIMDTMMIARFLSETGFFSASSYRLEDLCRDLNIITEFHNSTNDIKATFKLYLDLVGMLE